MRIIIAIMYWSLRALKTHLFSSKIHVVIKVSFMLFVYDALNLFENLSNTRTFLSLLSLVRLTPFLYEYLLSFVLQ